MKMELEKIKVRLMKEDEIPIVASIASLSFRGLKNFDKAEEWIRCNYRAYPRMQYFVAADEKIYGYILWNEKGGFREEAILELEQIAVHPDYRGRGIGKKLIRESLEEMKKYLFKRGSKLKLVEITTGASNYAQKLYSETLNAKVVCKIPDFYSEDEVIMIARLR
jgi:ribosomal protein S18 acetylase RimI-like enzyme